MERATKALVQELNSFYTKNTSSLEVLPDYRLDQVVEMARNDSIVWGALTTLVDKTIEQGWRIERSSGGVDERAMNTLKNKGFDFWLREMVLHYALYNNAFGEYVYSPGGSVKELHVIDPTQMHVLTDEHGQVLSYEQRRYGVKGTVVSWKPDEILHIRDPSVKMGNWGEIGIKTIYQACLIKFHVKKFIGWLFQTNQFRGTHNIKAIDEDAVHRYMGFLKAAEQDISKPIIVEGDYQYTPGRDFGDLEQLNKLMYKMDEEILNLLQVPPIFAGLPDNSNRSNSDAQERALTTRIKSIQSLFAYYISSNLLKAFKLDGRRFVFNHPAVKNEKELLEVAQFMKSISIKDEVIANYLRDHGLPLPTGDIFEEDEEPSNDLLTQQMAPSRMRKGVDEANEDIGTGEDSSTREDQLVTRSRYSKFPYVYEYALQR